MPERRLVYRLDPKSPVTWLVGALVVAAAVGLAAIFFTVFLVVAAAGAIVLPILAWRRRRALRRSGAQPKVIDAEYEIRAPEE